MNNSRRQFLKKAAAAALVGGAATLGYTWWIEPHWIEWVHRPLPITNLPSHLHGETLLHISDLHIGPRVQTGYVKKSLAALHVFNPAFVVYTGDFVTYRGREQFDELDAVMPFAPFGRLGTVAVLGNHDYGHGWRDFLVAEEITSRLTRHQVRVLRNESMALDGLTIYGIDDYWSPNFAPAVGLSGYTDGEPALALCHNPDGVDQPGWETYRGWILAGHTHGGQCRPPFLPPPVLPVKNKRYSAGHIPVNDRLDLYINRGLGHMLRVRFNVRPEITIFHLQPA